eukprot:g3512.t1
MSELSPDERKARVSAMAFEAYSRANGANNAGRASTHPPSGGPAPEPALEPALELEPAELELWRTPRRPMGLRVDVWRALGPQRRLAVGACARAMAAPARAALVESLNVLPRVELLAAVESIGACARGPEARTRLREAAQGAWAAPSAHAVPHSPHRTNTTV